MAGKVTVIRASRTLQKRNEPKGKVKVAAYCRVSTEHEEQIGSFRNQIDYYTNLIGDNPDWEMTEIFTDEGISGTGTRKRTGFQEMIKACEDHKVDMVITKSISRFARNTADCLYYSRHLQDLGIPVYFEKERINTMDASGEILFTILSSIAQEESRNISENTRWGIRSRFQQGIPQINTNNFMGYDKGKNGQLVVNKEQAKVVRRIFRAYLEGWTEKEISAELNRKDVPGISGNARWAPITITRMLSNEKYKGDLIMQKFYTVNFLSKKLAENNGSLDKYEVKDAHEAIVSKNDWEAVQLEKVRREEFCKAHGIRTLANAEGNEFFSRVFSADNGCRMLKVSIKGQRGSFWHPADKARTTTDHLPDRTIRKSFRTAWNYIVENRECYLPQWKKTVNEGNAQEKLRAKQMIDLTAEPPITRDIPELTRMVLQEITVQNPTQMTVVFLDGTKVPVLAETPK